MSFSKRGLISNVNNTFNNINQTIINGGEFIIGKIQNNKMIIILIIIFSILSYYYYKTKIAPKLTPDYIPNNEFVENKKYKIKIIMQHCIYLKQIGAIYVEK